MKKAVFLLIGLWLLKAGFSQNPLLLKDVYAGATSGGVGQIVRTTNYVFFNADDEDADQYKGLYRTDGTTGGTLKINLADTGYLSSSASSLTPFGNKVIFAGDNLNNYGEIWASDGTQAGTIAIENFLPPEGQGSLAIGEIAALDTIVLYGVKSDSGHLMLRKTNGKRRSGTLVYDFGVNTTSGAILALFKNINNILYFIYYNPATGVDQLWRSNGTTAGTYMVKDFTASRYVASYLMPAGSNFYIMLVEPGVGNVLWKSDGTAGGTVPVKTIGTSGNNNYPANAAIGSTLYFAGLDAIAGKELWKTDGTAAGTVRVADINPDTASSAPYAFAVLNSQLYFAAYAPASGTELWKYNGTTASLVKDIKPGAEGSLVRYIVESNNRLVFSANADSTYGNELWVSDGTAANTYMVADIAPGSESSTPVWFVPGNPTYFTANSSVTGREIYKFDNSGGPVKNFYVNDQSISGDVFTTAPGNNGSTGAPNAPFATLSYAASRAAAGDTIFVDAGSYTEQVTLTKSITIYGAGSAKTYLKGPAGTLMPPPGTFTEKAIIQTIEDVGIVNINGLTIEGPNSDEVHAVAIQGGGTVSNCAFNQVNNGIFFRYSGSAAKTALAVNNVMTNLGYVGINFAGTKLTSLSINNTIDLTNAGYGMGIIAGFDFGALPSLTVTGNKFIGYNGWGINMNTANNNNAINNNSFTGVAGNAITSGGTANATCNWFGTTDADSIKVRVSSNVTYLPWLGSGIDTSTAVGFQPPANACSAGKNYYVNDNSTTGDILTTAIGNNANAGTKAAPFATISYAVSQAKEGETVFVDAGSFTEQITLLKGVTIRGAGSQKTILNGPAALLLPPGSFTEKGIIQTGENVGDVNIDGITIEGPVSDEVHAIAIQGGGRVSNCVFNRVNNGIFFRYPGTIDRTAVSINNVMTNLGYVGVNFAGSRLFSSCINNTIDLTNSGYGMGIIAGFDFGALPYLTVTGTKFIGYNGWGISMNTTDSNNAIYYNSFNGVAGKAIANQTGVRVNAACNWYNTNNIEAITAQVDARVEYRPWLVNGNDTSAAPGFQPDGNSCTGRLKIMYVNDNSRVGDVFTTAVGNDQNAGTAAKPFATLEYAYTFVQDGDTLFIDAGNYPQPYSAGLINRAVTVLGPNYLISPNDAANPLLANASRNAEAVISGIKYSIETNNLTVKGLTFSAGTDTAIILRNGSIAYNNLVIERNRFIVGGTSAVNITGSSTANPSCQNISVGYNRFEKTDTSSGTSVYIFGFENASISNNAFVLNGGRAYAQSAAFFQSPFVGSVTNFTFNNNYGDKVRIALGGRFNQANITNNYFSNASIALQLYNYYSKSGTINIKGNKFPNFVDMGINYQRTYGDLPGTNNITITDNELSYNATGKTAALARMMLVYHASTVLNGSAVINNNKLNISGDFSGVSSTGIAAIEVYPGSVKKTTLSGNELVFSGTGAKTTVFPKTPVLYPSGILVRTEGSSSAMSASSETAITNNAIQGFKQSVAFFDLANTSGYTPSIGYGFIPGGAVVNINNNSFTGDSLSINNGDTSQVVNASCNWYGSTDAVNVSSKITRKTVRSAAFLTSATDTDMATGFQPVSGSCMSVSSFSPSEGPAGSVTIIKGLGFTGVTGVKFNGTNAPVFSVNTDTSIVVTVPQGASTGTLQILKPAASATSSNNFMVIPLPTADTVRLCPGSNGILLSSVKGSSYQWQVFNDTGVVNIVNGLNYSGVDKDTLRLLNIPAEWNGAQYRCVVNGSSVSKLLTVRVTNYWTGSGTTSDWNDPMNWGCSGQSPNINTDVIISSGSVILTAPSTAKSIWVAPGATISVAPGVVLTIKNQ